MFKLLGILCVLGVVRAIPIPDEDDFKYAYLFNKVNPSVQTYSAVNEVRQPAVSFNKPVFRVDDDDDDHFDFDDDSHRFFYSAQPQTMQIRQPVAVNNFQPNTYSANIFRVDDDDRYDFDDDDIRFFQAAAQPQPTIMTYSTNAAADKTLQPISKTAQVASETSPHQLTARSIPLTYQSVVINHDFDDDVSGEVFRSFVPTDGSRAMVYSGFRDQSGVQTYSAVNDVRQPAVSFNTPVFRVDDDDDDHFDFNDDSHRIFYSAQPQTIEVRQPVAVNNVQPNTYSANIFRVDDDDRYDFDDDDIRFFQAAAQPQPTVMTYSANAAADKTLQPIIKTAQATSETSPHQRTARSIPLTHQSVVINHNFDDDVSGEVFRSFVPTDGSRAMVYSGFRDQSGEFEDSNDYNRKSYYEST